jgi:hypothetical protein
MPQKTPTMIRLSEEDRAWLRERGEANERTMSQEMRFLIGEARRADNGNGEHHG